MKGFLQTILKKSWKKITLGTSDAWSTICLSHRPSYPEYYISNWRIFGGTPCTNHQFLHLLLWMLKYFLPWGKCTYYPSSPLFLRKSVWCVMSLNFDLENFANNLLGFGALEVYHPSCSPFSITFDIRYTCISLTDTDYSRLTNRRRSYVYWFWIFFYGLG